MHCVEALELLNFEERQNKKHAEKRVSMMLSAAQSEHVIFEAALFFGFCSPEICHNQF